MRVINRQYTMASDGLGGWTDETIVETKADMRGTMRAAQVGVSGLDGGTWSIYVKIPGNDDVWFTLATGKATSTLYAIDAELPVDQIKVAVAGAGMGAAPLVDVLWLPWTSRQGV